MYTCASCTVLACANNEPDKMPKNCPMRNTSVMENSRDGYDLPENISISTLRPSKDLVTVSGPG